MNSFSSYTPVQRSWGDIMDDEDRAIEKKSNKIKSNKNNYLSEVNSNDTRKTTSNNSSTACKSFLKRYRGVKRKAVAVPVETDEKKLSVRQRQIDIGKNTDGYRNYICDVDKKDRTRDHPWTPDKFTVCSTRSWQGVMRIWRRKLHFWDPSASSKEPVNFLNLPTSTSDSDHPHTTGPKQLNESFETDVVEYCSSQGSSTEHHDPEDYYHDLENDIDNFYKAHYSTDYE